ncbi:MAG: hypothetical protein WC089_04305 [Candidatus Paceibacterota bacterium]
MINKKLIYVFVGLIIIVIVFLFLNKKDEVKINSNLVGVSQDSDFFSKESNKPANFNTHYVVTSVPCGTNCNSFYVIDKLSGQVYNAPKSEVPGSPSYYKANYNLNSSNFDLIYLKDSVEFAHEYDFVNGVFEDLYSDADPSVN